MIKIEEVDIHGFKAAIRGMRNPMNSWDKSDSRGGLLREFELGENDHELAKKLTKSGPDHAKFLRMITVTMDITAPLYWWKEFDTYKVGTVANSCSTMHKLFDKQFEVSDFSADNMSTEGMEDLLTICTMLNKYRHKYAQTHAKKDWYSAIKLLPESYNQKRTVQLNYEVLSRIWFSRKGHRLSEWREFREFITKLPYNDLITKDTCDSWN